MPKKLSRDWKSLVIVAETIILAVLLWKVLPKNAAETNIQMKFGDQSLKLNVKKDMSDPQALVEKLMSQPFSKAGTMAFLSKEGIFSISDPSIVPALQNLCPNKNSDGETLVARQQRLQACLESNVLKQIRELATKHAPPFQYIGREVEVGTPARAQPRIGHAFVCSNGGFLAHKIQINTLQGNRSITVNATRFYPCTGYDDVPDIQISARDAYKLFGRPTRKFEKAVAVVL